MVHIPQGQGAGAFTIGVEGAQGVRLGFFMARWIVFAGITALLITGYFATFYAKGASFWRSVQHVPATLQKDADAALVQIGAKWARVEIDGQIATLSGVAPTEADRDDANQALREAAGRGGPWWGGITQVRDQSKLAEAVKPYVWIATLGADKRISLRGNVPGQRMRHAIRAEAARLFPTGVDDQMQVARGHPTGAWEKTAIFSLQQLAQLQSGDARFADSVITIRGQARDAAVQAQIYAAVAKQVQRPYQGIAQLTLGDAVAFLPDAPDETVPVATVLTPVQRSAAADCRKLIDEAMRDNTVTFPTASVALSPEGKSLLDRMARTAIDCATVRLRITGYTDVSTLETSMPGLSQSRAEATAAYLSEKGVTTERMTAFGAGSSQPVGDVSKPEDQAKSRRIEISVMP
jgi:outer membrane protein OmpA-like peptidoglycan-associated protein